MSTHTGYHPDFDSSRYPKLVRMAIPNIAAQLYITRSFNPIQIGNSEYFAILVRPTDEFSVYINTDREVLILFSQYKTFEIRTLEAFAAFYDQLESARVDRSLRFLISDDDKIENIIKHYLDQHPEYPIIIPTTFSQIAQRGKHSLKEAVRRNYVLRDLFGYQNPLREETFFFGRQFVVSSVLDLAKSGQSSSLFGLRKSGKTSAIYAIQRKAKGHLINVAVIDCQNPAVHARRYDSLLSYIVSEIRRSSGQKKALPDLGEKIEEISENFFIQMNSTLGSSKNNVLLIFDEIENISPRTAASQHWREGKDTLLFWQIVRSYIQSEARGRLSICLVGTSPRILEIPKINDIANPVYLFAQKQFIPSLSFDETREMVERLGYFMGLEFPVSIVSELHRQFGGHPFFTRQVCSKIHQLASATRPIKVSDGALQRATIEFQGQLESYLRDIIEQLKGDYPEEFAILVAVLSGNREELTEYGNETPELIDHLIGYGLVERIDRDFDIRFSAIKTALSHVFLRSGEDRLAEISKRRNTLESGIRVTLFHWCRNIAPEGWDEILSRNLTKRRYEDLATTEPRILFSNRESPLYLSDLLCLLKDPLVLPFIEDRRSEIIKRIDQVNKLRKDAHALSVTDAEFASAQFAFDYLDAEFAEP
jgi:hypothetical protein